MLYNPRWKLITIVAFLVRPALPQLVYIYALSRMTIRQFWFCFIQSKAYLGICWEKTLFNVFYTKSQWCKGQPGHQESKKEQQTNDICAWPFHCQRAFTMKKRLSIQLVLKVSMKMLFLVGKWRPPYLGSEIELITRNNMITRIGFVSTYSSSHHINLI